MNYRIPVVPHECCQLTADEVLRAEQTASMLRREKPELRIDPLFQDLIPEQIVDAPSLHVDDLTTIQNFSNAEAFFQERARLRASDGDVLATGIPAIESYESYCCKALGLGSVHWITPDVGSSPMGLTQACWKDLQTRHDLIGQFNRGSLRYIHPHMGTKSIWELALLLRESSHNRVQVIASPPSVTQFANDKGEFTRLVATMFGERSIPASVVVWNLANAAKRLKEIDSTGGMIAVKLPQSAGGAGNLLIPASEIHARTLRETDEMLHDQLARLNYASGEELLVTHWIENLAGSPSAQLWIPPRSQGPPVLEGVFMQVIAPLNGGFTGFHPVELPPDKLEQITRRSLQIALVYQWLGYIGRCSFDLLLVGPNLEDAEVEFLECNGRWGGTSLPMTALNRIFGDWQNHDFICSMLKIAGSSQLPFSHLLQLMDHHLFDKATGTGKYILFNPQRIVSRDQVSAIAIGKGAIGKGLNLGTDPFAILQDRITRAVQDSL